MVTFAAATKNSHSFPTRAPAQCRVSHFVAITCSDPDDSCDLYNSNCRSHAKLVSPSRDPIGYVDGALMYGAYFGLTHTDASGECTNCCCCAEMIDTVVKPLPPRPRTGHDLTTIIDLSYKEAKESADCTFEWWEWSDNPPDPAIWPMKTWVDTTKVPELSKPFEASWGSRKKPCPGVETVKDRERPSVRATASKFD